jgi:hypothetical protein
MLVSASPGDLALAAILIAIVAYAGAILITRVFWENRK